MKHIILFTYTALLCLCNIIFVHAQPRVTVSNPQQVRITQPIDGSVFDGSRIKLSYTISGAAPKSVKILVDGRSEQLLTEVASGENTAWVDVPARDCKVGIIVQNEFGASAPAEINLVRTEQLLKPSLYILAIGVSEYANSDLQLKFAAKDANDFAQTMQQQEGLLYEKVEVRLLKDEKATATNIRDELYRLQVETTARDVAMLYMAGHGVNNHVGDFFFMPVDADVERINATCVGYTEIKSTIAAIAGKTVVFMDACHSGNVLGDNRRRAAVITQAVNDLAATENGAVVFTSSTGRQYSLENPEWNNGAFTKALVEGLSGKADLFGTNIISIKTLDSYIANRVKELTKGQQAPTTIIPTGIPDFPLTVVLQVEVTVKVVEVRDAGRGRSDAQAETKTDAEPANMAVVPSVAPPPTFVQPTTHFYAALAAGATTWGSYSLGEQTSGGAMLARADVAYILKNWLAVGLNVNVSYCNVDFSPAFRCSEMLLCVAPSIYGRWPIGKVSLVASAGAGLLNCRMLQVWWQDEQKNAETYSTFGIPMAAGIQYRLLKNIGIGLQAQTLVSGSIKDDSGHTRNPSGTGITLGVNFIF